MKQQLIETVTQLIAQRMNAAQTAMQAAQESANSETKSSAGDKYETGRAMGQLDRNMYAQQYEQARQEMAVINQLAEKVVSDQVIVPGALVKTTNGLFWIAVSVGQIEVNGQSVLVVSAQAPIGKMLLHKKVGDSIEWAGKKNQIEAIY
ncbi:MAG: transcription elongation factor [Cytophagia bacterium]|nr:MAG: transcription elongation factor [Runella sp.]TAG19733.1 MAG: transcription elongation factor [Cytophagales bacterium]TAG38885.1 MAG: transcription elongation factor [Cytophagia bacterium]TAG53188.1 MAG: transcription elongation factor [Runella slithyformis]TAG80527.1 MAG: transcription elongation factor [Cytophagales bacterium]